MNAWVLGIAGFLAGLVIFFVMFRYAPFGGALRWVFVSYGLGAAFVAAPAFVTLLLRSID